MSASQRATLDAAIIHALKALGVATTRQVCSAIGDHPLALVQNALRRLTKTGTIRRVKRGLYRLI
jgi:predicted transcriptional regulator of viral defense system